VVKRRPAAPAAPISPQTPGSPGVSFFGAVVSAPDSGKGLRVGPRRRHRSANAFAESVSERVLRIDRRKRRARESAGIVALRILMI
jgi:hypothetical protein